MKKKDLPQDESKLADFTREVCYVKNQEGKYESDLSTGWDVKSVALDKAWEEIDRRVLEAKEKVLKNEASPILYFMELKLMDIGVLAGYMNLWSWQVRRHFKPANFERLSEKTLQMYANTFEITVDELKNPTWK